MHPTTRTTLSLLLALSATTATFAEEETTAPCCETESHSHPPDGASLPSGIPSAHSIFNVESQWEDQTGRRGPLVQIGGRAQVVAMVYTSCQYACPRILADMKRIQSKLEEVPAKDLGFCLITIDPERDTVEAYQSYADRNKLEADRWTFLRGEESDILELANLLGVRYKRMQNGEFSHSNIITLLRPNGEISHQLNGLGADPAAIIAAAKDLFHHH